MDAGLQFKISNFNMSMRLCCVCYRTLMNETAPNLGFLDVSNTGNGERGTGNGERETGAGNRERGTGNGERESGNECTAVTCLII